VAGNVCQSIAHRHHPNPTHPSKPPPTLAAVQGLPVSPWLSWGKRVYTLPITHPMLEYLKDGVLDISVDLKPGKGRLAFKPMPAFLHLKRGRPLGSLRSMVMHDGTYDTSDSTPGDMVVDYALWSPGALRVDISERRMPFQDGGFLFGWGLLGC